MSRSKRDWNAVYAGKPPRPFDLGWLGKVLTRRGRALDLGCGDGGNAAGLTRLGWDVTGVDSSSAAIAAARRGAGSFREADITRISPEPIYDLVILNYALPERGAGRRRVLAAARAALAPGGALAVAEWDSRYAWWGGPSDYATPAEMAAAAAGLEGISATAASVPAYLSPAHQNGRPGPRVALRIVGFSARPLPAARLTEK